MAKNYLYLAPGVTFNEERHEYHKNGKQLSGVTGVIGDYLGISFPETFVGEARGEGLHVHKTIEEWIDNPHQRVNSVHPAVLWLTKTVVDACKEKPIALYSEVLVSDGFQYASSVDIIAELPDGKLHLFDMKRSFKRPSVTLQLSMYKYFIEKYTDREVAALTCASFRDKDYFPIFARTPREVERILYKNQVQVRKL